MPRPSRHQRTNDRRWRALRLVILERDGWRCRQCGGAGRLEVDHVTPLARGGARYDPDNLQTLDRACHVKKTRHENGRPHDPERDRWRAYLAIQ